MGLDHVPVGVDLDHAGPVHEEDVALVPLLVGADHLRDHVHFQAHAGHAQQLAVGVAHPVVDEDGQDVVRGLVGVHVQVHVAPGLDEVVEPDVVGVLGADFLQDAVVIVVVPGFRGDEEAGEEAVPVPYLAQVADDLVQVLLAVGGPVLEEGVVGHERGDVGRPDEVGLYLRIDGVCGQGQGAGQYLLVHGLLGDAVVDHAGDEESQEENDGQDDDQTCLEGETVHGVNLYCPATMDTYDGRPGKSSPADVSWAGRTGRRTRRNTTMSVNGARLPGCLRDACRAGRPGRQGPKEIAATVPSPLIPPGRTSPRALPSRPGPRPRRRWGSAQRCAGPRRRRGPADGG